jgi:short-subunit dehydrogenase
MRAVLSVHGSAYSLVWAGSGGVPVPGKIPSDSFVSSPREELQNLAAVIVTGGSSGIGKSFIGTTAKLEPSLLFCNLSRRIPDINLPELKLRHFGCDLARPEEIERTVPLLVEHLNSVAPRGRVLLINNSGFGAYGKFPEPNLSEQLAMADVNMRAVLHLTGLLLPMLRQRGGAVMNIASTAAFQPTPYLGTYGATKSFLLHWSIALCEELRGSGVRVLAVCPGPTSTGFSQRAGLQPGQLAEGPRMTSEDVVLASYRALAAGKSVVIPGAKNRFLATLAGLVPKPLAARIAARMIAGRRLPPERR